MPTQNNEWLLGESFTRSTEITSLKITNLHELCTGSVHTKNEFQDFLTQVIKTTFS